ncbi:MULTISPECIES: hypothetical protein [Pseudofrankia]|uniref:hypothetical protein n=1 Tax=Pseudofrankia TaxID=2994363 RepID=UPI000234B753|nr:MULTISPECIES: hypothetical protein [Pseudofrankia]OHV30430.1 hypothetical protein BCD49_33830 [Pseudofrankia sp. EUN1h]
MVLAPELIVDADSHITEPPGVLTARVPATYWRDVPPVVRQGAADTWVLHSERLAPAGAAR